MTVSTLQRPKIDLKPHVLLTMACAAFILLLLVYPLGRMLWQVVVAGDLGAAFSVFSQPWFAEVFLNTAIVVLVSTLLAVSTGALLAWVNERTDASLGPVGSLIPIIPLLIPNVALSIGWVFIAAPLVGFLNGLLTALPDWMSFQVNIYSWAGLIFVYTINGVPLVYLVVAAALKNLDPALEEASRINGAGLLRTLRMVSGPAVKPALFAAGLLVTINGLGLYSIPAVIATTARIDVLTTRIVALLNRDFPPRMAEAQMLGVVMLLTVGILWYFQTRSTRSGQFATIGGRAAGNSKLALGGWKWPARLATIGYLASTSLVPILALLTVSLQPYWTPNVNFAVLGFGNFVNVIHVNRLTASALGNSLALSSMGALIAMAIAIVVAINTVDRKSILALGTDAAITSSAAIPHLILAVGFLVAFSGAPFFLSGTALMLLLAFVVMYIPPGSIAATSALAQIGRDLREASYTSGASEGATVRKIVIPLAVPGFVAGWAIIFVHMMGDLSAAALLSGINNPVIGFAILAIWETGTFGVLAAFSMILCVINIAVIGAMMGVGKLFSRC